MWKVIIFGCILGQILADGVYVDVAAVARLSLVGIRVADVTAVTFDVVCVCVFLDSCLSRPHASMRTRKRRWEFRQTAEVIHPNVWKGYHFDYVQRRRIPSGGAWVKKCSGVHRGPLSISLSTALGGFSACAWLRALFMILLQLQYTFWEPNLQVPEQ